MCLSAYLLPRIITELNDYVPVDSEVAIGYRQVAHANDAARAYGVVVNPTKSTLVTFTAHDRVIVLAES